MHLVRWFREWRGFVAEEKNRRELKLRKEVEGIIEQNCSEFMSKDIIDYVRWYDRHHG